MNELIIEGRLPSFNDYISEYRRNKYCDAKYKETTEEVIGLYIRVAVRNGKLQPVTNPCCAHIEWHEGAKRDIDNIQSGQKFIFDALQKNGILPNDSQRWVTQIYHKVVRDKNEFVRVRLEEKE